MPQRSCRRHWAQNVAHRRSVRAGGPHPRVSLPSTAIAHPGSVRQVTRIGSLLMSTAANIPTINSGSSSRLRAQIPEGSKQHSEKPFVIALLTGGIDKPYAIGLTSALTDLGISVDYIGSNDVDGPELYKTSLVRFLNFRGDQSENVKFWAKLLRVMKYYARLIRYAAGDGPTIFHILWNNRFEFFDRTLLMLYYRLLGKKVVFTAHNVNVGKRNENDTWLNRLTLKIQYRLGNHIFVHTQKKKKELATQFQVPEPQVSGIPPRINNMFSSNNH